MYGFVTNDPIIRWDKLGLSFWGWITGHEGWLPGNQGFTGWQEDFIDAIDQPVGGGGEHQGDWIDAVFDLGDWLAGNVPSETTYKPGSATSDKMSKSPIGNKLRQGYLNKFKDKKCREWGNYTNVRLSFGINEFIESIPNGAAHFVGSGSGDAHTVKIDLLKCKVSARFVITNTTSLKSAFYHLIPDSWNNTTTGTSGANWKQYYIWEETFCCEK